MQSNSSGRLLFVMLTGIVLGTSTSHSTAANAPAVGRQPNIVFILVDDLGWSDLGCYGHPFHNTPHIDRLAQEGLRMTNGYAPAPICSASRASILTGRTVARLGFEFVTKNETGHQKVDMEMPLATPKITLNLPLSEVTIAEHLNQLNYHTAFFGKWHISQHYKRKYLAWHPEFGPRKQGFTFAHEDFGDHPYSWRKKKASPDLAEGEFPKDSMVEATASHIRKSGSERKPFFVMASSFYVHTPVKNRTRWLVKKYEPHIPGNSPRRKQRLEYAAFVETLDHHVGTILNAIDASGQRDNTLVFLMSDNGGHPEFTTNAPLRGSKWNLYEGGIRVPMLARWPGVIESGVSTDTAVIGYDVLPTFVDVAGGTVPSVDGISIQPLFNDPNWSPNRSLVWHFPYYHPESTFSKAIDRIGVGDFATSKTRPQSALRNGQYKVLKFAEDNRVELYDLDKDIAEQHDLTQSNTVLAKRLEQELDRRLQQMNARRAIRKDIAPD